MSHFISRKWIYILRNLCFTKQSFGCIAYVGKGRNCIFRNQDSYFLGLWGNSFSTSVTAYSDFVTELPVDNLEKLKLLDNIDVVIKSETTHIDAKKEARRRKMKLTILKDPKTNNPVAFKLMTPDQFKMHTTAKATKEFKIKTVCSDHDLQTTVDKIEKVLKKGYPVTLKIQLMNYETDETLKDQMESNLRDTFTQMGYEVSYIGSNFISIKPKI